PGNGRHPGNGCHPGKKSWMSHEVVQRTLWCLRRGKKVTAQVYRSDRNNGIRVLLVLRTELRVRKNPYLRQKIGLPVLQEGRTGAWSARHFLLSTLEFLFLPAFLSWIQKLSFSVPEVPIRTV